MVNSKASSTSCQSDNETMNIKEDQVVGYLRRNPDFFARQDDLLADISLPHNSGSAISLLERQVNILRERGTEARQKLNNLLENARNNDQLFDTTQNLVLALLRAADATEIAEIAQDQLSNHANVDACELIVIEHEGLDIASTVRTQSAENLKTEFEDIFRLKRTHCGSLDQEATDQLFQNNATSIRSTALCPVISNGEVLAILALGNQREDTFSVNLDTLFLDFIGRVIGAVLGKHMAPSKDQ